jgi:hypothetical protein
MKKLLYLAIPILLYSCDQKTTKLQQVKLQQTEIHKGSKFKNLLKKYKEISFDTLKVFSSYELNSRQYKFKGIQLDSVDVSLFSKDLAERYINDNGYFACYKFSIDSNTIGLLTRTPSTYEPSSIKLLIFDKQKDTITNTIELAKVFGDAGDSAEKTTWLFKDKNQKYNSFIWITESHDNSVEDENDKTIERWDRYFLLNISESKIDTLKTTEKELLLRFGKLIK